MGNFILEFEIKKKRRYWDKAVATHPESEINLPWGYGEKIADHLKDASAGEVAKQPAIGETSV